MIVLSLKYTLFIILTFNFVNGYNKVYTNFTNNIKNLEEQGLTVVDTDNRRILYFIVNHNDEYVNEYSRRSDDHSKIELQVENQLNGIEKALDFNKRTTTTDAPEPTFQEKIQFVHHFLKTHIQSTQYFYNELVRIKSTGIVKDNIRRLISFLEMDEYHWVKKKLFKCFIQARKKAWKPNIEYWAHDPNDLTFNIV